MRPYPLALAVVSYCWLVFAVVWLLAAFWTKRSVYRESSARRLGYLIPILVSGFLLRRGHRLPDPLSLRVIPYLPALAWLSAALCVAGLAFCLWARFTLGRNWSGVVTLKRGHELIVRGPYAWVRHPIYTGVLAMLLATVLVVGHVAGLIALLPAMASFWWKLQFEEELMRQQFPHDYPPYEQRVKRLIPFVL